MKRVLVTGGSKGIGAAIAARCLIQGHRVCTLQRHEPEGFGGQSTHFFWREFDLGWDYDRIRRETRLAIQDLGGLDWLVLAGGMGAYMGINDFDPARAYEMMSVNYLGPRFVLHASMRSLMRAASGKSADSSRVLWLGSTVVDPPGASALEDYAATKGAVHGFAASFARHYARMGVRLNVLATSWVATPMTDAIRDRNPDLYAKIVGHSPLRRMATADEVAEAAYSILDGPDYWHGDIVRLTGGAG